MVKVWLVILCLSVVLGAKSCTSDSDCPDLNSCIDEECVHKDLLPIKSLEIVGLCVVFLVAIVANSAGVGGGEIMVPIILLVFLFDPDSAIPLSQTVIFGGSLTSSSIKLFMRHPTKDRPLIYYSMIMHIQSTLLLGTTIGVVLNEVLPSWFILSLLTVILLYITYVSLKR